MKNKPLIAFAALATLAPAAHAQQTSNLNFGGSVGVYMPTNSRVKDAFGSSVFNIGIGPVGSNRPSSGSLTPSIDFLSASNDGNRLFIGTLTYGYERHLAEGLTVPYVRVFGGGAYFDYGIDQPGGRESAKRIGGVAGAEIGLVFAQRLRVAARYNFYTKQDFDFNGLTLTATYALFKL